MRVEKTRKREGKVGQSKQLSRPNRFVPCEERRNNTLQIKVSQQLYQLRDNFGDSEEGDEACVQDEVTVTPTLSSTREQTANKR